MLTKMTKRNEKGFTLVEIMIVVAIIGLLAAIAIPNLLRARVNANDNAVQGDLRAASTAAESFRAAQNPPAYPASFNTMSTAAPPYLDTTWTGTPVKHGHTLAYAVTSGNQNFTVTATAVAGAANNGYCIDHTGTLRVNVGAAPAAQDGACTGTVVQQ